MEFPSEACLKALVSKVTARDAAAAKMAVRAVVALYGDETASKHLAATISTLVDGLTVPRSEKAAQSVGASIAAISMAVRLMPQVMRFRMKLVALWTHMTHV